LARAQPALPTVYPPPEYDKPYEVLLITHRLATQEEVRKVCPSSNFNVFIACTWRIQNGCLVIMVSDEVIQSYKLTPETVLRHEIGHCHGWPANHPGAIVVRAGEEASR
jgi:hypothetical protein